MMELVWLVPGLPLGAFILLILLGRRLGRAGAWLSVGALTGSLIATLAMAQPVLRGGRLTVRWAWLSETASRWSLGWEVDGLSWLMLLVVTSVGTMILLYSTGYMRHDPRIVRFFAYLSLFCASMLGLVMAEHLVLLYCCWELVGVCSYLLIGFWFEKPAAAAAGKKAFITTRVGDTGLLLGILLLAWAGGPLRVPDLASAKGMLSEELLTSVSVLVFLGAMGKSAQVPLHVWLPDAMEGPTPVSALIHAATMVAAGVYLIARTMPLFTPISLSVVLAIGLLTHLSAATAALAMTDLKRVLAYSTISQLGLMMTALGLGAVSLAMFHLAMHACFKALLFLGAGSVIHATHRQDLAELGGLRRPMPWTATMFLIAASSMSGVFPLSGFWSKDAIVLKAGLTHPGLAWALLGGAVMTAAYVFRLSLRCFWGPPPGAPPHPAAAGRPAGEPASPPHESPMSMLLPMAVLALGALAAGLTGAPWFHHPFFRLVGGSDAHEGLDLPVLLWSTAAAGVGIWLALTVGLRRRNLLPRLMRPLGFRLYRLAAAAYGVDALYDRLLIQPLHRLTASLARADLRLIDGAVNGAGSAGWSLGQWKERFDRLVVDRIVNALAEAIQALGARLRWMQTGIVQHYLLVVVAAVIVLSVVLRR